MNKKIRSFAVILIWIIAMLALGILPTPRVAHAFATGNTCPSGLTPTAITPGFSTGGVGTFCFVASDLGAYIQSWGTVAVQINGVDYTNVYATTDSILRTTSGQYYVYYNSTNASSSFSTNGTSGITSCTAVWCSVAQYSSAPFPPYTMFNNIWGATSGQQISVENYNNWSVFANFPETSGVKSYPNASLDLTGKTLGSLTSCTSNFKVTPPSTGSFEAAYDIWVPSEVMIWMYQNGKVGPIAQAWNSDGTPVAAATNVSVGGDTWNVYHGGSNVVSFVRLSNTTSATVDVLAILNWIAAQGWISSSGSLGKFQFGYEITSAPNGLNFVVNDYNMMCGGLGTTVGSSGPTSTPAPKTNTPVPTTGPTATKTNTPAPTNTFVPPTATTVPPTKTNTPIPTSGPSSTPAPTKTNTPIPTTGPTSTAVPPTKTNTPAPTSSGSDPCSSPTVITGGGTFSITTASTCFKYVNTSFVNGGMFSVMKDGTSTSDALKWYGGTDQNVTSCANQSSTISGNGGQLDNFVVSKDSSGQMFLTITGGAANSVTISIQNWQNGAGCSVKPTVHP